MNDSEVGDAVSPPELVELLTVRLTIVVCVRVPEVPVIVTPMVIGAAELVAEIVSLLVPVPLIAPNVADRPLGSPGDAKVTEFGLKLPVGVIVMVVDALDPGATVTLLGDAERLKSGAVVVPVTVTLTVVVWLNVPEVPVIVTGVAPPAVAVLLAVSVKVLPLNDAVTPLGIPEAL